MQIKILNENIEIDEGCCQVSAVSVDSAVEKVYGTLKNMEEPVLLDVGANIGVFSLIAKLIQDLTVYAFEPFSKVFELLKSNVNLNGLQDRVKVFEKGLFDKKIIKKLKCCTGLNSGMSCFGKNFQLKIPYEEKEIETDTIDNIVKRENIEKVNFIKIDTEGCEYYVLKGAEETIKKYYPMILVECVQRRTVNFNLTPDDVIGLLKKYGYQSFDQFSENDILAKKNV